MKFSKIKYGLTKKLRYTKTYKIYIINNKFIIFESYIFQIETSYIFFQIFFFGQIFFFRFCFQIRNFFETIFIFFNIKYLFIYLLKSYTHFPKHYPSNLNPKFRLINHMIRSVYLSF